MAIRNIVRVGDDVLAKECRPVEVFDNKLRQLLDDMQDTLYEANGAGLAAPQVGVLRQVCVIDVGDGLVELINPEIVHVEGEQSGAEGCLSLPDEWGMVSRPQRVTVKAQNRKGKWFETTGEDLFARCICHEVDHLHGIVFTDKASRMLTPEEIEQMQKEQEQQEQKGKRRKRRR
ncbi:peptide deformylase [Acutalibacter sp. 1XD8-36]|uniref:peptide deformylase n=1 Tax=Acutalibacter sp. 1XD8-36 TaxID=2320852 RepID=UPI001372F06D|nr:peptide deformylase [Acutalibacter sp. 1XD8-36]NBJ88039.1 peptide deformylase [Acutalibacter sp. 1XD8-36]